MRRPDRIHHIFVITNYNFDVGQVAQLSELVILNFTITLASRRIVITVTETTSESRKEFLGLGPSPGRSHVCPLI
jgi:hypothetical protein